MGAPRQVVILATPEVSALEVASAAEVFALAGKKPHEAGRPHSRGYQVRLLTCTPQTQPLGSAVGLRAEGSFQDFNEPIDTLLVAGDLEPWSGRGGSRSSARPWPRRPRVARGWPNCPSGSSRTSGSR